MRGGVSGEPLVGARRSVETAEEAKPGQGPTTWRPDRPLEACDVGRDALPASVAKPPIIGVAAGPLAAICLLVAGARVDDGEIAKDTDDHVVLADILDRGAATDLRKEGL